MSKGATSVENLWKGAKNHEGLRTTGLNKTILINKIFAFNEKPSCITSLLGRSEGDSQPNTSKICVEQWW